MTVLLCVLGADAIEFPLSFPVCNIFVIDDAKHWHPISNAYRLSIRNKMKPKISLVCATDALSHCPSLAVRANYNLNFIDA